MPTAKREAWSLDQLARSAFFHQKLHEWGVVQIGEEIRRLRGEKFEWDLDVLGISQKAWNKVIHRGIKPVVVFAHPDVLMKVPGAIRYYRMLSMVSQKSMGQIGLPITTLEQVGIVKDPARAQQNAHRFNQIVSLLIESEESIDAREFDIWRGMAAGSQAQGSWGDVKGN